jgi:predicted secreted protein
LKALVRRISVSGIAIWSCALPILTGSISARLTHAQDEPVPASMRRIEFQVERSREVTNDLATALLRVTHDDVDPARLADRVNGDVRWAAELAKKQTGIAVESGSYYTNPIREKERITGWTASQELVLTTRDTSQLTRLVAQLQERLQLASLQFSVSLERRRAVEDELISDALAAYARRAELIRRDLAARSHELVYLSVNTSGATPPVPARFAEMGYAGSSRVTEPAVEAGTSTLSVSVSATIELR